MIGTEKSFDSCLLFISFESFLFLVLRESKRFRRRDLDTMWCMSFKAPVPCLDTKAVRKIERSALTR